ncbi:hypothetical protein GCM10023166_33960 [Paeniglutamicibacter cryotolerans]
MKKVSRRTLKSISTGTLALAMLALGAASASAHVHVDSDNTTASGYTHLTFNVPNESPTAKTNKLVVSLPTDTPFTYVGVKPVEGWTAEVLTTKLPKPVLVSGSTVTKAATSVVWTADATHAIGQNEYQSFSLSVGMLPEAGTTVTLPATQTYTDGSIVKWDQPSTDGQVEPEHPAPAFVTTSEDSSTPGHAMSSPEPTAAAESPATGNAASILALVLGAAGLVLGGTALGLILTGRRRTSAS